MLPGMTDHTMYLPYEDAADLAGVTTVTVGRWVARGLLDAFPDRLDGRRRLVARNQLEQLIAVHAPAAAA